jgi:hypothetical protein
VQQSQLGRIPKEIPIERIFRNVTGKKMTQAENLYFHLIPKRKPSPRPKWDLAANRPTYLYGEIVTKNAKSLNCHSCHFK